MRLAEALLDQLRERAFPAHARAESTVVILAAAHVMSLIRQMRGGKDYDSSFGSRLRGEGPFAQLIAQRFAKAHARLGFGRHPALDVSKFVAPLRPSPQGDLFGRPAP